MRHYGQKWSLDKSSIIISHFSKGGVKLTILALQKTDSAKKNKDLSSSSIPSLCTCRTSIFKKNECKQKYHD